MTICSDVAAAVDEQLIGTASQAEHWLLVEVRAAWGRDPVADTALPEAMRVRLESWLAETPRSRLLFIRRPDRRETGVTVFRSRVAEHGGTLHRFELNRHEDLLDADLDDHGHDRATPTPLWLVCSHGRRDACCARLGTPLYETLRAHLPREEVWQSSHQGGHRFAPNLLVLPQGIQLGRVSPVDVERVVAELAENVVPLPFYRGRTIHSPSVQAAELAVREKLDAAHLTAIRYIGPAPDGRGHSFETGSGDVHVVVDERPGPPRPESCGAEPKASTVYSVRWD